MSESPIGSHLALLLMPPRGAHVGNIVTTVHTVAQGEVLKAKAAVEEAELNLGYTQIKATFDGKLSKTNVELGNLVNAGGGETLLTTLVNVDPMYVEFNVDERSLRRYQE